MRIIFLLYHGFSESSGISKKILCQIKALRELGHRVNVCTYDMNKNRHRVRMMDEEIIEDYGTGKWAAVRKRISYDGIYRYAVAQEVVNEVGDISAGNAVDRNVLFLLAGFQPLHKLPVIVAVLVHGFG